jgi:hypothetical protein
VIGAPRAAWVSVRTPLFFFLVFFRIIQVYQSPLRVNIKKYKEYENILNSLYLNILGLVAMSNERVLGLVIIMLDLRNLNLGLC